MQTRDTSILKEPCMWKVPVSIAVFLVSPPADAERLERITEYTNTRGAKVELSIDLDTFKSISGKRHVWAVFDYEEPQPALSRSLEFSHFSRVRSARFYDCQNKLYAEGSFTWYTADAKVHTRVVKSEADLVLKPIEEGSTNALLLERVCAGPTETAPEVPAIRSAKSTGTGFRVADNYFVTNNHVVTGCQVLSVNGKTGRVKAVDSRNDLALVEAEVPGSTAPLRNQPPQVGEAVSISGYPLRGLLSGFNITTGNVSSLTGLGGDSRMIQLTAPVQPGNSGGPVIDAYGNIIGVVVAKLDALKAAKITGDIPQNVNFAIHPQLLKNFLAGQGIKYKSSFSKAVVPVTEIAEKAKDHTVLLECSG